VVAVTGVLWSCGDEKEADHRPASARLIERDPANTERPVLVLGSKRFTEQLILVEIYAQALKAAGFRVRRGPALSTDRAAMDALRAGDIDGYPEYTGTALTASFGERLEDLSKDPGRAYAPPCSCSARPISGDPRLRQDVRKEVVCYATSVIEQEWPAMADGKVSNVPTHWSATIRRTAIRQVRSGADDAAGSAIISRDGERATAREERLAEAHPSVPQMMYWLMVLAVVVALVLIGVVTAKDVGKGVHVVVVLTAAVVFGSTLLLIRDLDQPYDGLNARDPVQTTYVRDQMRAEVVGPLPCDERGLPTDAPLFRPQTAALH
jgi:Substrate binding domain of ABC-type glycine betaine transport system